MSKEVFCKDCVHLVSRKMMVPHCGRQHHHWACTAGFEGFHPITGRVLDAVPEEINGALDCRGFEQKPPPAPKVPKSRWWRRWSR